MRGFTTALGLALLVGCSPVMADWVTHVYGPHASAAVGETADVPESSGVIASRTSPSVYWTHNDSGGYLPRVYAFRLSAADVLAGVARHLGHVELTGAAMADWEDIAAGPGNTLYVFDGGDNPPCSRTNKRIYRFAEPTIDPDGDPVALNLAYETMRFEYPDSANPSQPADADEERYDAECLFVHPDTADVYIVTKRTNADVADARVYRLPGDVIDWTGATVHVLQFVIDISAVVPSMVTAGDVDAAGRRVIVRNYTTAYEFTLPEGEPFDAIFEQMPRSISLLGELQGEGICYAADGGDVISTAEVIFIGPQTFPVFITPWELANARAETVHMYRATIRWDTADELASTVDYGPTTTYGQTAADPDPVTGHEVPLADLVPGQQYYYRVASGALSHPPTAEADQVTFVTLAHSRADFDTDGDVDQEDFGHLQECFAGPAVPHAGPACISADLDMDDDVDLDDFDLFQACAAGPNIAPPPTCRR